MLVNIRLLINIRITADSHTVFCYIMEDFRKHSFLQTLGQRQVKV